MADWMKEPPKPEELKETSWMDAPPSEDELKGHLSLDEKPSQLESAARGLAQGATLGFADEIAGGAEALFTDKPYKQARDESRANFKRAETENPGSFTAGQIGGGVATAIVPGLNAANSLRAMMATGAALGGATGLGASEKEDLGGMAEDTLKGVGIGAAGGAAGYGISKAVPWAAKTAGEKLKAIAEMRAVKSLGGSKKQMQDLIESGGANRLGRNLLDNKVVTALAGKEKMADRLDDLATSKVGDLTSKLKSVSGAEGLGLDDQLRLEASKFSPGEAAQALKDKMAKDYAFVPQSIRDKQGEVIDEWLSQPGRMDALDAQKFKTQMQKWIKDPSYHNSNPGVAQETLKGIRNQIKTGIERNADEFANIVGESSGQIKGINQDLGGIFQGQDMLDDAIARGSKNRTISLTDYISGAGGAAAGGPQGILAALANKGVREKGSQVSAVALDKASKFLLKSPRMQQLAQTNPPAFKAMAQAIASKAGNATGRVASYEPEDKPISEESAKSAFIEGN